MKSLHVTALLAGCATLAAVGTAGAGGFNRGVANLDGLYGDGRLGLYTGFTYVAPERTYETISGVVVDTFAPTPFSQTDLEFSDPYTVPYASVGGRIIGRFELRWFLFATIRRRLSIFRRHYFSHR